MRISKNLRAFCLEQNIVCSFWKRVESTRFRRISSEVFKIGIRYWNWMGNESSIGSDIGYRQLLSQVLNITEFVFSFMFNTQYLFWTPLDLTTFELCKLKIIFVLKFSWLHCSESYVVTIKFFLQIQGLMHSITWIDNNEQKHNKM